MRWVETIAPFRIQRSRDGWSRNEGRNDSRVMVHFCSWKMPTRSNITCLPTWSLCKTIWLFVLSIMRSESVFCLTKKCWINRGIVHTKGMWRGSDLRELCLIGIIRYTPIDHQHLRMRSRKPIRNSLISLTNLRTILISQHKWTVIFKE